MIYLIFPLILTSVTLYLGLTLFGNISLIWWGSALVGLVLSFIFRSKLELSLRWWQILIVILFVLIKAFVISPLVATKVIDGFTHLQITPVGDYYKHTFVVSTIKTDGLPPVNPYFPSTNLSYYYGYYLLPALVSKLTNLYPNWVLYLYVFLTDLISLLIIVEIFNKELRSWFKSLLATLLLFTSFGIDTLPIILDKFNLISSGLASSLSSEKIGLQLINNYSSLIYVPQHFFPAALSVGLIYYLLKTKPNIFITVITLVFIFLSSVFVSMTLIFWLGLLFIYRSDRRVLLIISGIASVLISLPYLYYLSGRSNLFYFYQLAPYDFGFNWLINLILTFVTKYGFLLILLPILAIIKAKINWVYLIGLGVPFLLTWVIRTPIYNDFSLRTLIPLQLILPLFWLKIIEDLKYKKLLILLTITTVFLSGLSFGFEYLKYWQTRQIMPPKDSELLLKVRELPDDIKLSSVDRDRWVEFIPSLGFKKVLSPFLYDSYVYFDHSKGLEHGEYERLAVDLFIEETVGRDQMDLINQKNIQLSKLNYFFSKYPSDKLILSNKLWVKKDTNPWIGIFSLIGVKTEPLTSEFTFVKTQSLLEKTKVNNLSFEIKDQKKLEVKEGRVLLERGVWFITSCHFGSSKHLKLEFEDYNLLFNKGVSGVNEACLGKIFYLKDTENILINNLSTVKSIEVYPLKIESALPSGVE